MSRPRDPDGFDDRPGDPAGGDAGWHEPAHIGEGSGPAPRQEPAAWEPPGWSLPDARESAAGAPVPGGADTATDVVPDPFGMRAWAALQGWQVSDGTGPRDAVLTELLAAAPVRRLGREHRPANVVR